MFPIVSPGTKALASSVNPRTPAFVALTLCAFGALSADPLPVTTIRAPDRVRVEVGGKLFTEYVFTGAHRPYLYPILAADQTELNREFPMTSPAGEDHDHPHHRSLWFAHSSVDGFDFWNEGGKQPKGDIVNVSVDASSGGEEATIKSENKWVCADGSIACTDETLIRFRGDATTRTIDYRVTLKAPDSRPALFGDAKDGTMAMRLAQWMTLTHDYNKVSEPGVGRILTATGQRDQDAWGKRANWCDYYAPHEGKTYGVAIFDTPGNLRYPTWWMARDYGLFGANPFGQHDYENLKDQPHIGDYTIPAGGSLTLRYRFYFHNGDEQAAKLADQYAAYAAGK